MLCFGLMWWMICERKACRKGFWWLDRLERCLHAAAGYQAHKIGSLPYMYVCALLSRNTITNQMETQNNTNQLQITSSLCNAKKKWWVGGLNETFVCNFIFSILGSNLLLLFENWYNSMLLSDNVALLAPSVHICRHQTSLPAIRQTQSSPRWTASLQKLSFFFFCTSFYLFKYISENKFRHVPNAE